MYKYSRYNTIIKNEDNYTLYNSYNNNCIFIVSELKDLIEAGIADNINEMKNFHPTFYTHLIDNNFLVLKNVDEIQLVKNKRYEIDYNEGEFIVTINPTMNCNFKCWYCYETHIKKSQLEVKENILNFFENLNQNTKIKKLELSFFGGEPLLYFERDVTPIIDKYISIERFENKVSFTTNGFLINDFFVQYFVTNNIDCFLQITLDGNRELHNKVRFVSEKKGSYDKIIENVKKCIKHKNFYIKLRINYTSDNIESCNEIYKDLEGIEDKIKKEQLDIDFHRVWQDDENDDIITKVDNVIQTFEKRNFNANCIRNSPDNVNSSCYADKLNSVVINYNGDIYKCTARDFSSKNRNGYLTKDGILVWENDHLNKRMDSKFKNKPCLDCKILPICNGGCTQHAIESKGEDYCIYYGDENLKNEIVKNKITEIIEN